MTKQIISQDDMTIFVIDDDTSVRRSLRRLLSTENYQVAEFESANAFLQSEPYPRNGCIVLDVNMPGVDGMTLHDKLIQQGCDLPVIFLTGHGDIPMSVSAMKKGANDFLTKPVDEQVLLTTIAEAIANHQHNHKKRTVDDSIQLRVNSLTEREHEVMQHVIAGERNKEIAIQLGISEKTVKVHRAHVMEKMAVTSVAELVRICVASSKFTEQATSE